MTVLDLLLPLAATMYAGYLLGLIVSRKKHEKEKEHYRKEFDARIELIQKMVDILKKITTSAQQESTKKYDKLMATFHINMMRAHPEKSHQEITDEINKSLGE